MCVLKVSWYKFKLECFRIPVVATKKITIEYRQKRERKKLGFHNNKSITKHKRGSAGNKDAGNKE